MTEAPREDRRQQPKPRKPQLLKPATAAAKLGVYLPATPPEFQSQSISRDDLQALQADPPEWLVTLRKEGPHPRSETSRRLGVSNSALARVGVSDAMTTAEIRALLDDQPEWLRVEREKFAAAKGRVLPGDEEPLTDEEIEEPEFDPDEDHRPELDPRGNDLRGATWLEAGGPQV